MTKTMRVPFLGGVALALALVLGLAALAPGYAQAKEYSYKGITVGTAEVTATQDVQYVPGKDAYYIDYQASFQPSVQLYQKYKSVTDQLAAAAKQTGQTVDVSTLAGYVDEDGSYAKATITFPEGVTPMMKKGWYEFDGLNILKLDDYYYSPNTNTLTVTFKLKDGWEKHLDEVYNSTLKATKVLTFKGVAKLAASDFVAGQTLTTTGGVTGTFKNTLADDHVMALAVASALNHEGIAVTSIPKTKTVSKTGITRTTTLTGAELTGENTSISVAKATYAGSAVEPAVTVQYKGAKKNVLLTEGVDYTVSYANNEAVGTGTVTITGTGAYTGNATKDFAIAQDPYLAKIDEAIAAAKQAQEQATAAATKAGEAATSAADAATKADTAATKATDAATKADSAAKDAQAAKDAATEAKTSADAAKASADAAQGAATNAKSAADTAAGNAQTAYENAKAAANAAQTAAASAKAASDNAKAAADNAQKVADSGASATDIKAASDNAKAAADAAQDAAAKAEAAQAAATDAAVKAETAQTAANGAKASADAAKASADAALAAVTKKDEPKDEPAKVVKSNQTLAVSTVAKTNVKAKTVKKKAKTVKVIKRVTGAKTAVSYQISTAKKGKKSYKSKFKVNAKTGKVTVKKGVKKGTYKITIRVSAGANANYNAASKTVTVKIVVK